MWHRDWAGVKIICAGNFLYCSMAVVARSDDFNIEPVFDLGDRIDQMVGVKRGIES